MIYRVKVNKREKLEFEITFDCRGSGEAKEIGLIRNYTNEVIEGYRKLRTESYFTINFLYPAFAKAVDYALHNLPFDLYDPNVKCQTAEIDIQKTTLINENIYTADNLLLNHSGISFQPLGKLEITKSQIDQIIGMQILDSNGDCLVEIQEEHDIHDYIACIQMVKRARSRERLEERLEAYLYP